MLFVVKWTAQCVRRRSVNCLASKATSAEVSPVMLHTTYTDIGFLLL